MRGTTQTIYALALRVQALLGLILVGWLVTAVVMAGQYAGVSMIIGVIAGVISLACLWSYLTPGWLGHPTGKGQLIPLTVAHIVLFFLYAFIAINAVVTSQLSGELRSQLAISMISLLSGAALLNIIVGARLCMTSGTADQSDETGSVTELVLPKAAPRRVTSEEADAGAGLSRAS